VGGLAKRGSCRDEEAVWPIRKEADFGSLSASSRMDDVSCGENDGMEMWRMPSHFERRKDGCAGGQCFGESWRSISNSSTGI
jgi:hypothetical protein